MAEDTVAAYLAEKGIRPLGLLLSSRKWFTEHPDAFEAARECREYGLSRRQTLEFLAEKHGFPFSSINSLHAVYE